VTWISISAQNSPRGPRTARPQPLQRQRLPPPQLVDENVEDSTVLETYGPAAAGGVMAGAAIVGLIWTKHKRPSTSPISDLEASQVKIDDAENQPSTQDLELEPDAFGKPIPLRFVKFQNV